MALVVKDRVKETTTTTGTGTITLAGAATGFQSFSVIGDGNTTYYAITSGNDWEVGIGTYTSTGTTLSRDTILESSNAGSAITLSGTSDVFCTYPAERSVNTADIGISIQAYDADTAKYDDTTANFTGTLQNGGSNVVVDSDIGSTVQGYDADTTKNDVANTFTANQTINANLIVDTNTLYVDATGNRVGIGNAATDISGTSLDQLIVGAGSGNQGMVIDSGAGSVSRYGFAEAGTIKGGMAYDGTGNTIDFYVEGITTPVADINSSGTVTATTFSGALSGNATTATTLQTARTINGVSFNGSANIVAEPYVEDDEGTAATRLLTFVDNSTAGYKRLNEDSSLTYNPNTNTLTAGAFVGDGSGLTGISAGGGFSNMDVITSTSTWTNPGSVTKVKVTVVGAGGGGAHGLPAEGQYGGGGGGGGGTAIEVLTIPTSPVPVTIGAGGQGGNFYPNATCPGAPGGTSSFGAYCSATGGGGGYGQPSPIAAGGAGGAGSGGTINLKGGVGGYGRPPYLGPIRMVVKGKGGASYFGENQGIGGENIMVKSPSNLPSGDAIGQVGSNYGNGGSCNLYEGGNPTPAPNRGNGAAGVVIVEY